MDEAVFQIVGYKPPGCNVTPVSFKGNPNSPEVQALVKRYTEEIKLIEDILNSEDFLEITLERCTSPREI